MRTSSTPRPRFIASCQPIYATRSPIVFACASTKTSGEPEITDELNPVVKAIRMAAPCTALHNEFNTSVSANYFTKDVGFFYYRQRDGDPCTTHVGAHVDENLALTSITNAGYLAGPFPTMIIQAKGLGHYISALIDGLPGGWLFPTWAQPVVTSPTCTACQNNTQYSNSVRGTRIKP